MDGLLLKSNDGDLGIALVDEARKVQKVCYLSDTHNLNITFTNGVSEDLVTEINPFFEDSLFGRKKILIGHFPHGDFDKDPINEYYVQLDL